MPRKGHGSANPRQGLDSVLPVLQKGIGHHQSGNLALAAQCYEHILATVPDQPDALHLLGVVHHQSGDYQRAVDLIGRAVTTGPDNSEAHSNLGAALAAAGDVDAAEQAFRRAVEIDPGFLDAHANLAALSVRLGRDREAIGSFQKAHALNPEEPRFVKRLGDLYLKAGQYAEAEDWYGRYCSLSGGDAETLNNAGYACERLGRLEAAADYYRKAFETDPGQPELASNLASTLARLGQPDEAEKFLEQALSAPVESWEDPANLAGALFNRGRIEDALTLFRSLAAERPEDAGIHRDMGIALLRTREVAAAETALRRAIDLDGGLDDARVDLARCVLLKGDMAEAIDLLGKVGENSPQFVAAAMDLALVLSECGEAGRACDIARKAVAHPDFRPSMFAKPLSVFRSACAFDDLATLTGSLDNVADRDLSGWAGVFLELLTWADTDEKVDSLVALHRRWGDRLMTGVPATAFDEAALSQRTGPIRVGLVSSDLRKHSVARFVLPLLEHYDCEALSIYCYASREEVGDEIQQHIRGLVREFRIVGDQSHARLAETIRDDRIDILFELNGFTEDSRQRVMAFRPAPVQVCWLGYPFTRGLSAMDYILLDEGLLPSQRDWLVETPLQMPGSFVCYDPFEATSPAAEPPAVRNGYTTFGTLNNPYKFTRDTIALWAAVLNRVAGSRCLFAHMAYDEPLIADNIAAEFTRHGIDRERLSFVNNRPSGESHFACYDGIDLSLDSFPLTGGTTSCDALWMGVPVVTLVGPAMHQRLTFSMLKTLGCEELAAHDPDGFVEIASGLAVNIDRLRAYRRELRLAMQTSALGDPARFGREFSILMQDVARRHGLRR